jgi:flagellar M-ring protein FliF
VEAASHGESAQGGADMNALLEGFKALGVGRLAAMAAVATAMLLMLAFLVLRSGNSDRMALLYSDVDLREASQIVDLLDKAHIAHDSQGDGSRLMVPASEIPRARMLLAKEGLPTGGSIGYEIFDRGDGLTASQFQQAINQTRALEGELARSIRMIMGVKAARVHLVLPKREPFSRDRQEAQASVVLAMVGAARLDKEGIQSVLNLVSSAVPGLRAQNIGIIDSRGNMLARAGEPVGGGAGAAGEDLRHQTEQRLSRAVEDMLERIIGAGRVRAESAVEMDFGQIRETKESYDPEGRVERSTQNNTANTKTTEQAANVSVQNNLPNADAGSTPTGTQEQRTEETTNYEIGKTVRTVIQDQPQIRRISLAVLVDQVAVTGADGKLTWQDRPAEDLTRIAALARSAIGFNEKRGDKVEVVSMRFAPEEITDAGKNTIFGLPIDKADLLHLGQTALYGLVAILALLLVLRPMVMRITAAPEQLAAASAGALALSPAAAGAAASMGGQLALAGRSDPAGLLEDESMVNISNIEGAIKASSIRRIAEMMEKHPEESMGIMRGWMQQEQA